MRVAQETKHATHHDELAGAKWYPPVRQSGFGSAMRLVGVPGVRACALVCDARHRLTMHYWSVKAACEKIHDFGPVARTLYASPEAAGLRSTGRGPRAAGYNARRGGTTDGRCRSARTAHTRDPAARPARRRCGPRA